MALHCPECGFVNAEGANYCQKCGAFVGPLDSPYVNRHRIETHHLQDGDELQVGKYKLTFLSR